VIKKIAAGIFPRLLKNVPKDKKWLYPFYLAGQLHLSEETYESAHLPAAFDNLSIAFLSDIHYGPFLKKEEALSVVQKVVDLDTDLIILGGDYGDIPTNSLAFFNLIPTFPADKTVLAVLGNHDIGAKHQIIVPDILDAMRAKNIIPLVNETHILTREGKRLAVCGPDDKRCGRPDFEPLIAASQDADFVLFIPHSPDLIPDAYAADFAFHLALCGHTHGGQLVFFGRTLHSSSIYKDRYRSGWYQENGVDIRVSNGVGTSILPMRIGPVPEIHHIVLRAKA
jgi:predicted MPP superfamily phosphohydrolase